MKAVFTLLFALNGLLWMASCSSEPELDHEVVVYGATPGGIIAAVTAADHGATVLLIEPTEVLGGMYSSGLNTAESEHMINDVITGRARDFYIELGDRYYDSAYFQTFGNGRGLNFRKGDPAFFFESKHATALFEDMLARAGVEVMRNAHLQATEKAGTAIRALTLSNGQTVHGRYFVDASYEGDLMAQAGVPYTYGREPISQYNESLAGVRLIDDTLKARTVDEKGRLLPWFNRYDTLIPGSGDKRVMNYNFRPIMTQDPHNMVPIRRPDDYDATRFDFLADFLADQPDTHIWDLVGRYKRGSGKYEFNNQQRSLVSLGLFGGNAGYTEGDWETRQRIYDDHKSWTLGFLYFLSHDPRVPESLREETRSHGFARDEFVGNDHFPVYLYVREGRRMLGAYVHTQHDVFRDRQKEEAVMLGSHWVDSHHVQRIALSDSTFTNEGRIWEMVVLPFEISYRVMTPPQEACTNLLVPVCASFSHVGFCAYRLESTWMQAGHVAGLAVSQALRADEAVQQISVPELQASLHAEGMVLEADSITDYHDYDWLRDHPRYGGMRYRRIYAEYGIEVE